MWIQEIDNYRFDLSRIKWIWRYSLQAANHIIWK